MRWSDLSDVSSITGLEEKALLCGAFGRVGLCVAKMKSFDFMTNPEHCSALRRRFLLAHLSFPLVIMRPTDRADNY